MDSLLQYSSDEDSDKKKTKITVKTPALSSQSLVNTAPTISHKLSATKQAVVDPAVKQITHNPTCSELWLPVEGPRNPNHIQGLTPGQRNTLTGFAEKHDMSHFAFHDQYHTFHNWGYAYDPSDGAAPGQTVGACNVDLNLPGGTVSSTTTTVPKRRRLESGDPGTDKYLGPWAPPADEDRRPEPMTAEQIAFMEEKEKNKPARRGRDEPLVIEEKSMFHGGEEVDYQGRTYLSPPSDLKNEPHDCYIPKKLLHTWSGHSKGVAAIRLFPQTGHLLLSAGMDSKVKIWDVYNSRKCLRTFLGHSKAVRDIQFSNDGRTFLTCSYDRYVKHWDTETGQCLGGYTTGKTPFCCTFNPDADKQHIFLMGMSNKKIIQWDMRSNKLEQDYDQHLAAVNTVTFVDGNRRIVSTSDDKKIFVWEFGIPVPIKYISEPHMHSVPAVCVSPNEKFFLGQSMDNQIVTYMTERFKFYKKKRFAGHICAGYAIQPAMSPDGQFVMSGDSDGQLIFWEWKSCRIFRKLKVHEGVTIGCAWHPIEQSRVVTCGWDGLIKYWD